MTSCTMELMLDGMLTISHILCCEVSRCKSSFMYCVGAMQTIFRGWQMKIGCLLLFFALIMCGSLLRSRFRTSGVYFRVKDTFVCITSYDGRIVVVFRAALGIDPSFSWIDCSGGVINPTRRHEINHRRNWLIGEFFDMTEGMSTPPQRFRMWLIPHWKLMLPLTLMGGWFIFQSRKHQRNIATPVIAEIAADKPMV